MAHLTRLVTAHGYRNHLEEIRVQVFDGDGDRGGRELLALTEREAIRLIDQLKAALRQAEED